jgi:hypothetical protein
MSKLIDMLLSNSGSIQNAPRLRHSPKFRNVKTKLVHAYTTRTTNLVMLSSLSFPTLDQMNGGSKLTLQRLSVVFNTV